MFSTRICEKPGYERNIKERLEALVEIHSTSKESSNETLASNNTLSISEDEELIKFKSSVIAFSECLFFLKLKNTVSF